MTAFSRALAGALAALGLLVLAACGAANSLKPVALLDDGAAAGRASLEDTRSGFTLTVSPDSFLEGEAAGDFTLAVGSLNDELVVTIEVTGAQSLRALYCELSYDEARYTPLGVEHLPMSPGAGDDEMLTLTVLDRPGAVHVGQVLAHWQGRGSQTDHSLPIPCGLSASRWSQLK